MLSVAMATAEAITAIMREHDVGGQQCCHHAADGTECNCSGSWHVEESPSS